MTTAAWPLFGLTIRTPRLTLRYLDDPSAAELSLQVAEFGVHADDAMPFLVPWTHKPTPVLERESMQHWWGLRAALTPTSWTLPFGVWEGDSVLGIQSLGSKDFAVTRTVVTGSWLLRPAQGRGVGKEMRSAVLELAFTGLGALVATTEAFVDNPASLGVTRSLGYVENGWAVNNREGTAAKEHAFVLERSSWAGRPDIAFEGLEPCLEMLGVTSSTEQP